MGTDKLNISNEELIFNSPQFFRKDITNFSDTNSWRWAALSYDQKTAGRNSMVRYLEAISVLGIPVYRENYYFYDAYGLVTRGNVFYVGNDGLISEDFADTLTKAIEIGLTLRPKPR